MEFLTTQEIPKLRNILSNYPPFHSIRGQQNFLEVSGLKSYTGRLQLSESPSTFIMSVFAKLSGVYTTKNQSRKLALVVFLESILADAEENLNEEEREFIEQVIKKCNQWEQSKNSPNQLESTFSQPPIQSSVNNKGTGCEQEQSIVSVQSQQSQQFNSVVERDPVFISYSHQDQEWLTKLQKHLKPMIRNQTLQVWDDTKIKPGAEWRKEIENALAAAKVAVLLVSPDFLASDFIADNELPPLLDAAKAKGLTIIWIPLSFSSYRETEIEKYQAAHPPNQPLDSLNIAEQNRALVDICTKIKAAVQSL